MPWVRFDDQFPIHRKVAGLSDPAFRLHTSAIFWCARNLTDGHVSTADLEDVCARVRAPARFATELVDRDIWHLADEQCPSAKCIAPVAGGDGYVIHDYLEYQPSRSKVLQTRAARAKAGAQGGRRSGESRRRSSPATGSKNEANTKQVASQLLEPRPGPLRGQGAGGPAPDSGSAAYGDRPTPDGIGTPSPGAGPPAPQNPANQPDTPPNPRHAAARAALAKAQDEWRQGPHSAR